MRGGMDIKDFKNFKQVWSGHIHLRQKTYNFQFVGSPYHLTRHDIDDQKGLYILDIDKGTYDFIPNKISPEYKILEITKAEDIKKLNLNDYNKDRIDLKISNKLLIENKEIRSKVEELLQNNKFEKIDWQDEIELEDVVDESSVDFVEGEVDYNIKKLTYEYVNKQKFEENSIIKDHILKILDQMFEIYETAKKD
jgi:DNA repair exonuclease SbcCD nuclease subunit